MNRIVTFGLMFVLASATLFGQAKWGGIARQVAMGGSNAGTSLVLNPFIIEDPAYMLLNPAYQAMYRDYVWLNVGGGTLAGLTTVDNGYGKQNAGINFAIDKEWTVGAIFSYDPSVANAVNGLIAGTGGAALGFPTGSISQRISPSTQTIPSIRNVWEALASYDGGNLDLGFGFSYGTSNSDSTGSQGTTSATKEASSHMFGFRAGGILDLGGGNALDFSAALRLDKATDKITRTPAPTVANDGEYSASGTEIQLTARGKFKLSNRVNVVPYGAFATISAEPKEDTKPTVATTATTSSLKASAYALALGIGSEYKTTDVYIAGGLSFASAQVKAEAASGTTFSGTYKTSYSAVPVVNLGAEWWFLDWLAGRAGYFRALGSLKNKADVTVSGVSSSTETNVTTPLSAAVIGGLGFNGNDESLITLGLGFRFGNFSLDATVSEEALRRGFGLVGANDNLNTFGFMNLSYNFH